MKTLVAVVLLAAPHAVLAQVLWVPPGERVPDAPKRIVMTVDAAAVPVPALKYSLLPKYRDRSPGNAAPYYYRATLAHTAFRGRLYALPEEQRHPLDADFRIEDWTLKSRKDFPRELARKLVNAHSNVLEDLEVAVHREHCDWDLRFRDMQGMEAIAFILEEFQHTRSLARLLIIKARLEIAEGRHEDAIATLQMGYQMGSDVSRVPILVNDLIGLAIAGMMRGELTELIATPDCPNLYWALAAIPEPYVDLRTSMKQEALLAENIFTFLKDADTATHAAEEWDRIIREAGRSVHELAGFTQLFHQPREPWLADLAAAGHVAKGYPDAIERLVAGGMDRAAVEAMPVGRVIAIDAQRSFRHTRDEMFKWTLLPWREGWRRFRAAEKDLQKAGHIGPNSREVLPIASLLLPAVGAAGVAQIRTERDFRVLRVIEALRIHAAEHGSFPKSLDDITAVPVPDDPWNDAPFPYRLEDGRAILEAPSPEGFPKRGMARVYEITLRQGESGKRKAESGERANSDR